jgi:hypothetical protein
VTVLLLAAALIAGTGAIAALAPLDSRLGIVGLAAALIAAALVADPFPEPAVLAVRLTGALLAVVTLRAAAASVTATGSAEARGWSGHAIDSQLGWPSEILLGIAGAVAGLALALAIGRVAGVGGEVGQAATIVPADLLGAESLALAVAGLIVAIGMGPLLADAALLRRAIAAVLVTEAAILVRGALVPTGSPLDDVLMAGLLVVVAVAGAAVVLAEGGRGARASLGERGGPGRGAARGAGAGVAANPAPGEGRLAARTIARDRSATHRP